MKTVTDRVADQMADHMTDHIVDVHQSVDKETSALALSSASTPLPEITNLTSRSSLRRYAFLRSID